MNEIITNDKEFKDLVHVIRGQQVMLDSDLADLYGYEVKRLNEQVTRNIEKFPEDFMYELTNTEMTLLSKSQIATTIQTKGKKGGRTSKIRVFTEIGVYMLATVLKGKVATEQSMYIMRSFQKMKHCIAENQQLISNEEILKLSNHMIDQDKRITGIESIMVTKTDIDKIMDNFLDDTPIKEITFLEGQKFEANEAYINIYKHAKHTIFMIDNYVDIDTLTLLKHKKRNVNITIFTAKKSVPKLHKLEVDNFNREYSSLYVKRIREFHDRYIVLDYGTSDEIMYHCGHSSKDTGNKVSTIHKMLDTEVMHPVIDRILENSDLLFR
ncbi:MAG: ORF6N domain-containing protein [Longicatena sp.]